MIKALIFDADGPLYYRDATVDEQKRSLLATFGFTGEFERFQQAYEHEKFKGYARVETVAQMFRHILHAIGVSATPDAAERFAEQFNDIQRQVILLSDAAATLKTLKSEGYKISVLTDSFFSAAEKRQWFNRLGVEAYIDDVVSSYDIRMLKDSPEAFRICLERLKVSASEAAFVGHQTYEIAGARAAHVVSVAITPIADANAEADYAVNALVDLPSLLKQINSAA